MWSITQGGSVQSRGGSRYPERGGVQEVLGCEHQRVGAGGGCAPSHAKHASFWICTFVEFEEVHSLTVFLMLTTKIKSINITQQCKFTTTAQQLYAVYAMCNPMLIQHP